MTSREEELATWIESIGGEIIKGKGVGIIIRKSSRISADDFRKFQDLPNLHTIEAEGVSVNDEAIQFLSGLPSLARVRFVSSDITDRSMEHLANFPLDQL